MINPTRVMRVMQVEADCVGEMGDFHRCRRPVTITLPRNIATGFPLGVLNVSGGIVRVQCEKDALIVGRNIEPTSYLDMPTAYGHAILMGIDSRTWLLLASEL